MIVEKRVILLNKNWLFSRAEENGMTAPEYVCLPHSVKLTQANSSGCRNFQGVCKYLKSFFVPPEYKGQKLFLRFEGAMGKSALYINGNEVSRHFCGYTPFITDITDNVNYGEENEIVITLDNSDDPLIPPGKPQDALDFSYDGGLYRSVTLTVCEPLYITDPILANEVAGGGIFVWYTDVSESSAAVHIRMHIKNEYPEMKNYSAVIALISPDGQRAAESKLNSRLNTGCCEYIETELRVCSPSLWSPESPLLYTLEASLLINDEQVFCDNTEIGIRDYIFTVNDGVIFNGKPRRFNGANYHQTWPYIGNAVPTSLLERDITKLKKAGFDNIRSHYPFGTDFLSACNRLGMTVIACNPGWQFCSTGLFLERAVQNMRDIVRWQRNNPAVLFWEPVLNESQMSFEIQKAFHDTVHEEFPYSPCYTASDYGPTDIAYCEYDPGMLGSGMEKYGLIERNDTVPRPMWVREYGDNPDNFCDQNAVWRAPRGWGDFPMTEAVKRMLHEFDAFTENNNQYIDVVNNSRLCGYGVWPGISHNRGYHINPCWGGHLDLFRIPKFSYYFMQSQQDREKAGDVLYIASWWTEMSPPDVTVYSNAEKVRLYIDGTLIGEQFPDDVRVSHPPFTFRDVKRKYKGRNRSVLRAEALVNGETVAEKSVKAPGIATRLMLVADYEGISLKADGSDIVAVRCSLIDNDGTVVPLSCDNHPIKFTVTGEGSIVGDSGIGANPICAEAGIATVLIKSTTNPGKIKITAEMLWKQNMWAAIKPAELNIYSE